MRGGEAEKLTDREEAVRLPLVARRPAHRAADARAEVRRAADSARKTKTTRAWPRKTIGCRASGLCDVAIARAQAADARSRTGSGRSSWLPAGERLVAAASAEAVRRPFNEAIYSVDANDGRFTPIACAARADRRVRRLARRHDASPMPARASTVPTPHDLWLQPVAGGPAAISPPQRSIGQSSAEVAGAHGRSPLVVAARLHERARDRRPPTVTRSRRAGSPATRRRSPHSHGTRSPTSAKRRRVRRSSG